MFCSQITCINNCMGVCLGQALSHSFCMRVGCYEKESNHHEWITRWQVTRNTKVTQDVFLIPYFNTDLKILIILKPFKYSITKLLWLWKLHGTTCVIKHWNFKKNSKCFSASVRILYVYIVVWLAEFICVHLFYRPKTYLNFNF